MRLDPKDVDLSALGKMVDPFRMGKQILIAIPRQDDFKTLKVLAKNGRIMLWISSTASEIQTKSLKAAASGIVGPNHVQLHLNDKKRSKGLEL